MTQMYNHLNCSRDENVLLYQTLTLCQPVPGKWGCLCWLGHPGTLCIWSWTSFLKGPQLCNVNSSTSNTLKSISRLIVPRVYNPMRQADIAEYNRPFTSSTLLANTAQLKPWGAPNAGSENNSCNHFPTPAHAVLHTSAKFLAATLLLHGWTQALIK